VVYTYFVSRLGVDAIAAVSLVFPVSLLALTAMGGGIGAGSSSAMARALGGGRRAEAAAIGGQALVLSVVVGIGFALVVQGLAPVREILRVAVPAARSTSGGHLGLMALTAVVPRLGPADLAAYGLGTRFDFLLMSFAYGFGAAVLTLVGMATGARRHERVGA